MIPLWLKIAYTVLAVIVASVYARKYPPGNFLWFSDIALLVTVPALWLESALLASMMAVGTLLPELVWNVSYFGRLLTGKHIAGLTDYMFDDKKPLYLRALSLFHVVLPVVLVWTVGRLRYDPDALLAQTLLAWVVLPLSYRLTPPRINVNWVFGPRGRPQRRFAPRVYLLIMMAAFPILLYVPTHLILVWLFS